MPTVSRSANLIRFGPFELDLRALELRKYGLRIKLQDRPFRILCLLLEDPGATVTREALKTEFWESGTFVDFDHGISSAVNKLRVALGDSAESPRYVETIGRHGYRFIAEVSREALAPVVADSASPKPGEVVKPGQARTRYGRIVFVVSAIVLLAAGTLSIQWVTQTAAPRVLHLQRITTSGKAEHWGRLHTDGARLFYSEHNGPHWPLMQTSVSGGDEQPVAAPFPNTRIFGFSPDYSELLIGNFVNMRGNVPLWIMPVQGGALLRVGDVNVDEAAWSPDGKRILFSRGTEVFSVDRDGRNLRRLFSTEGLAQDFAWNPDENSFRFTVATRNDERYIWEASADGSAVHPLLPGWSNAQPQCCGVWMPDGRNFVFTAGSEIWVLRRSQGLWFPKKNLPLQLTSGPNAFGNPLPSRDGKRLFVFGVDQRISVQRFDPQKETFAPYGLSVSAIDLAFSPDGEWVAYIRQPGLTLWRSRLDGSDALQLTSGPISALHPRWSHDGRHILFIGQLPQKSFTAYIVPAEGGGPLPVLENDSRYRNFADWSPDGESVVLGDAEDPAISEGIVNVNVRTHEISRIRDSQYKEYVRWSPDGRFLAAISPDAKTLLLYETESQRWTKAATVHFISRYEWAADSRHIYVQDILDPAQSVFRLDVNTGRLEKAVEFSKPLQSGATRASFEGIAPDGSYLVSVHLGWANVYALDVDLP